MAVTYGFFDSINGDRKYNSAQMSEYFEGLVSDGIYQTVGDAFSVTATGNGLDIAVGTGRGIIKNHWIKNDSALTISLSPADMSNPRRDAVVMRYDSENREMGLYVKTGTPSAGAFMPEIIKTDILYEIVVAVIYVDKNINILSQSAIQDNRGTGACPWITGLINQVDTSTLFLQFEAIFAEKIAEFDGYINQQQAAFDEFFSQLTQELSVDGFMKKYQAVFNTNVYVTSLAFGQQIPDYDKQNDIVLFFRNGMIQTEGERGTITDYWIENDGESATIELRLPASGNNKFVVIVLKNTVGQSVINAGSAELLTDGVRGRSGVAELIENIIQED